MIVRYLNIEVALGVIALATIAQRTLGVQLPISWYIVVPSAVWALYIIDRVIDVRNGADATLSGRHRFALRYRTPLTFIAIVALMIAAVTAVREFPFSYWLVAIALAVFTSTHLYWQRHASPLASIIKDVNVAVVFTVGAWSIPIVMAESFTLQHAFVLCAVVVIVLVDVILLSVLDHQRDAEANAPSISVIMGVRNAMVLARTLSIIIMIAVLTWVYQGGNTATGLTLAGMSAIYAVVPFTRLSDPDIARLCMEYVLAIPLWLLFA